MSLSTLEENIITLLQGKELTDQQMLQALRDAGVACETALLYATLRKMERKGLLLLHTDRPPNRIESHYQLTPMAERMLDRLQETRLILSHWHPSDP